MTSTVSANTKAVLLLTAPLIVGRSPHSTELLSPGEYNRLARGLSDNGREPADLLSPEASEVIEKVQAFVDGGRLMRLLERGFLLSQAIERWHARAIWIVSRADAEYPRRLKERLKDAAPGVLYGCGRISILETGGLAIVGSRDVNEELIKYTEAVGRLAAGATKTVVSGGARGIDRAAMQGALQADGCAVGVLADSLERFALARDLREYLLDDRLVLVSPYDPSAGFDVGNAMQRNKAIYALADAALVVNSDYEKGGTWAGAIEQLEKLHLVPVYVRSNGEASRGLEALQKKGALPWPNPQDPQILTEILAIKAVPTKAAQHELPFPTAGQPMIIRDSQQISAFRPSTASTEAPSTPAEELFAKARQLILQMRTPAQANEVAEFLGISEGQAREWLRRLVREGTLVKKRKLGYMIVSTAQKKLFESADAKE